MRYGMKLMVGAAVMALSVGVAQAETPADVLVMADEIDDIISWDPAEVFEFSAAERAANIYDRLISYDVNDVSKIYGHVAESWEVSEDGLAFTFKIRDGITFHSGNPLTAEDVAFSLRRAIKLNKTPSFILTQFGWTAENVDEMVQPIDANTVLLVLDKPYAPTFLLYCLTATIGSVVDMKTALEHESEGDFGYEWLKTNSAASGPFKLRSWKPNESVTLDGNPDYWGGDPANPVYGGTAPKLKRVITRHVPEHATQRLLLEKGDIDIARNLEPDQITSLRDNAEIAITEAPKGAIYYLGLNQKNEFLAKPEVRTALKYLIDYDGIATQILPGSAVIHQSFLPRGFLGAITDLPYSLDIDRAKGLLLEAGLDSGFTVTMDTRNTPTITSMAQAIQATWGKAGINVELLPGDNKQTLTKYRARTHDIYIGRWGPDYQDPNTNADTFATNPDNSDEGNNTGILAWRNSWDIPEMTQESYAALLEQDPAKRAAMYEEIQRQHQKTSPFVIMFQDIEIVASRANVQGMIWGPSFDDNKYNQAYKN